MISVESRDERKGIGAEKEMEDTELEEGEACYSQNVVDSTIDPDVSLSYIDEKIQDVLGHFQKDFEGGVSAENLGAKFGGYGSFLPTYQRSPAWSQQKTPPEVNDYKRQRSPNNLDLEASRHNLLASSNSTLATWPPGAGSPAAAMPLASHTASVNGQLKGEASIPFTSAEESTLKGELVQNLENTCDQKTLRVRIKVGCDNLPATKNAEIYSGLGLDVSPSSSSEDSFSDSEGLSRDIRDVPDESPTGILKIVTSFLLHGERLLSPLSDEFVCFAQKERYWGESVSKPLHKAKVNGFDSRKGNQKPSSEKKQTAYEKNDFLESVNGSADILLKKETDIDSLACEELVSYALRLPLLSNMQSSPYDSAKDTETAVHLARNSSKGCVREGPPYDIAEKKSLEPDSAQEMGKIQKSDGNVGSSGYILETKKANYVDNCSVYPRKLDKPRDDASPRVESNVSELGRVPDTEIIDSVKAKNVQGGTSYNENVADQSLRMEQMCTMGRSKLKGGQSYGTQKVEVLNDGSKNDTLLHERSKSTHANGLLSKSDSEGTRKDHRKAKNKYQEFFGDLELEQEDNEVVSKEKSSMKQLKDSELVQKGSMAECNGISKEKFSNGKTEKPSRIEEYPRVSSNEKNSLPVRGPRSYSAASVAAPLINDNEDWVQCDKCQAWRLLPLGTNPKSLPEKWVCSMLDWLPAMIHCGVSEEETTQASRDLYQASAPHLVLGAPPETPNKHHDHHGKTFSGVSSADAYDSAQDHQVLGQESSFIGGKKKYKSKGVPNRPKGVEPTESPNSVKKNLQAMAKSKNLNAVYHSTSTDEYGCQYFGQSSSSLGGKHGNKQTQKRSSLDNCSAGGDSKNLKTRNKAQDDIDGSRSSKKIKTKDALYNDENFISDQGRPVLKAGNCLSSNPPGSAPPKDQKKGKCLSEDSKSDAQNNLSFTEITSDDSSLPMRECDGKSSLKKRKGHANQDTRATNLHSVRHDSQESCENGQRKEKKARTSMPDAKDTSTSKVSGGIDRRAREMMDQRMGQDRGSSLSQQSVDAADALKRDFGPVQTSAAATSSSSKVSGSCKNKSNSQEVKGSPVESVSSSPLRVSSTEKFASTLRNSSKDGIQDGSFLGTSSPRRFSGGDGNGGSDWSGTLKRDVTHKVNHHESSMGDLQDRDLGLVSGRTIKEENRSLPDFATHQAVISADPRGNQSARKSWAPEQYQAKERRKDDWSHNNASHLKILENGSSSCPKDTAKASDSMNGSLDNTPPCDKKLKDGKSKFQEKPCVNAEKIGKNFSSEKDSAGKDLNEISEGENHSKFGSSDTSDNKINDITKQDPKQNIVLDSDIEKTSKKISPDQADGLEVSGRGNSSSLPPSAHYKNEKGTGLQPASGSHMENGAFVPPGTAHDDDTSRTPKQSKKGGKQNEVPSNSLRNPSPTLHKVRDRDGPPVRKDLSSQAATNAIKEAKDLKHMADRLKSSGSSDSTGMYFQAALKFLYGASLLESCNNENSKHNEIQSMQVYSSTAKLCGFCAHEYERSQDMAAAALAYKCMEVAYLRVIYSSHANASRDRNELQKALQIVPPVGESPSSSASDVDNLNNPAPLDKISSTKGVGSPQVAGNHGITARNRSSFLRLLNYAQDASHAMEAARKSRITFAAANSRPGQVHSGDGISSVKRALDFNFQDVDGLLRLVRIAMDAISR